MSQVTEELLNLCLDAMENGESVADILIRYPAEAVELQPLLQVATRLVELPPPPRPAARAASEQAFLAHAATLAQPKRRPRLVLPWWRRWAVALAAVLVLLLGSLSTEQVSQAALPGDFLYPVKRTAENARLSLSFGESARAALEERFALERAREIMALLASQRQERVNLKGTVTSVTPPTFVVQGVTVHLTADTIVAGEIVPGASVRILGVTEDGVFNAVQVAVNPTPRTGGPDPDGSLTPAATATPALRPGGDDNLRETEDAADGGTNDDNDGDGANQDNDDGDDNSGSGSDDGDDNSGSGNDDGDDDSGSGSDDGDDNSGSGNDDGDDNSGSGSGDGDDNSGSGSDDGDDNSGSGNDDGDDNSGSGSGDGDDNSGSGSGDGDDNSGSGSGDGDDNSGSGNDDDGDGEEEDNSGSSSDDEEEDEEDNSGSSSDDEEEE